MTFFSKLAKTFFSNGYYKILIYISIFVVLFYVNKNFQIEILEDNSIFINIYLINIISNFVYVVIYLKKN